MNGATGFALVCILWLLVRPYQGVRHDAILYLGQAMRHLWPEILGRDVFFVHGSQDSFTIVTTPLAWLLSNFGVAKVELALTAGSNLAFIGATWVLCGAIAPSRRWMCTVSVALLSHAYSRVSLFNYAENFFTARSLAEPLALLALAAWMRRRHTPAVALLALAALSHPLVTVPAIVIAWCMRVADDRRWLWGVAVLLPLAALGASGVAPFAGAFQRFDDTWWELIRQLDAQVRMSDWNEVDAGNAVLDFMLVGICWTLADAPARRLLAATLASSALLVMIAFAAGDMGRDVLVVQLQLWRVLWLTHTLAMLCLPIVVCDLWQEGGAGRIAAAASLVAVLAISWTLPHAWIFLLWLPLTLLMRHRPEGISEAVVKAALAATLCAVAAVSVVLIVMTYRLVTENAVLETVVRPEIALLSVPTVGAAAILAFGALLCRVPKWISASILIALIVLSAAQWDQRSEWRRTVESLAFERHPFARFIPRDAQVYWHTELLATWASLDRASFVSPDQAAGIVFNRSTAIDVAQRLNPVIGLLTEQAQCQMTANAANLNVECQPSQALVEEFCRQRPAPDFMVFDAAYARGLVAQWNYQIERGSRPRTAYLYDCARMR